MNIDQKQPKLDLGKQKSRLETKKAELEQSMVGLTEAHPTLVSSIEANEGPRDLGDIATDFSEIQDEQSLMVNQQSLLTLVDRALTRLAEGTYEVCPHCAKPIPVRRLEAIPWADRCVPCEERLEQINLSREEVYGTPRAFY